MNVPFFDSNPEIVNELRAMDHDTKEYKKNLQRILQEIGGPIYLLNNLKAVADGDLLRKKYYHQIIISSAFLVSLFIWIIVAATLIGDKDIALFNSSDIAIFIGFIVIEIISITSAMFYAFRCKSVLLQGVSYLIDNYQQDRNNANGKTLSDFKFEQSKKNRIVLIMAFLTFIIVFGIILFSNGTIHNLFASRTQEFSKAGMTITLTQDFHEKDVVSQTATYTSSKYVVICLKEEFQILEQFNISSDISLKEYAEDIIANNSIDSTVIGSENRPYFVYSRQVNGKEIIYLTTVYKGSDAYWAITFACDSKNYDSSQKQLMEWADTIKVT